MAMGKLIQAQNEPIISAQKHCYGNKKKLQIFLILFG